MSYKNKSILIENDIPQFIRLEYPNFVEFVKKYYEQQDQVGEAYEFIANSLEYLDIDLTTLDYLDNFAGQYLNSFPANINEDINHRTLIKHIREFYQSLGSESSIKLLFKMLFDEDIFVYRPTEDILRVSDGKWQDDYIIKISNNRADDTIIGLVGTELKGETSGSVALIEKVLTYEASNGFHIAECYLRNISPINDYANFEVGETVTGTTIDGLEYIEEQVYAIITDIDLTTNGLYNQAGDRIYVTSSNGVDAYIVVDQIEDGEITNLEIVNGGIDYAVNDQILFSSDTGRGAAAKVLTVDGNGTITAIKMIASGYSYKELPSISISSDAGTGAILYPVSPTIGKIKKFSINNFGVGYDIDEVEGFPYNFPIQFTFIPTQTYFYTYFYAYNDSWNLVRYKVTEVVQGQTSGATGILRKVNHDNGLFAFSQTSVADFVEGEDIIGLSSGASGYNIYKIFGSEGQIVPGSVGNYKGYYRNTDGYVSGNKYIQDSYYYQDFSYAITSFRERDLWIGPVKDLIHPAGAIVFGFADQDDVIASYTYGGFISPSLNSIELFKFAWQHQIFDERIDTEALLIDVNAETILDHGNTQLVQFQSNQIYEIAHIRIADYIEQYPDETINGETINILRNTSICFGSNVVYEYLETDGTPSIQNLLIDDTYRLLIDTENFLLI